MLMPMRRRKPQRKESRRASFVKLNSLVGAVQDSDNEVDVHESIDAIERSHWHVGHHFHFADAEPSHGGAYE